MVLFSLIMLYPLLWMLGSSFKPSNEIMRTADHLIPSTFTIRNYTYGWQGFARYTFATFFKNSFIIAIVQVV